MTLFHSALRLKYKLATAINEVPTISKNDMALITGVLPSLTWRYKLTGRVASWPTRKRVVLKFSKDIKNATAAAPKIAGRKNFRVICQMVSKRLAPRFMAASSRVRSNFFRRADTTRVAMNEN